MYKALEAWDQVQLLESKIDNNQRAFDLMNFKMHGINTIYAQLDLALNHNRPHIAAGRTPWQITDNACEQIEKLNEHFHVFVCPSNEWNIRHGLSHKSSALAFIPGIGLPGPNSTPNDPVLYVNKHHFPAEKKFYKDMLSKVGDKIEGIVLYLEPSVKESIDFTKKLARFIRRQGYKGHLLSNGIGAGAWYGGGVINAESANTINKYLTTNVIGFRNSDGIKDSQGDNIHADNAKQMVSTITGNPGAFGCGLYHDAFKGVGGQSIGEPWMWQYIVA